jgi:uncharacterized protein (DUF2062 family)
MPLEQPLIGPETANLRTPREEAPALGFAQVGNGRSAFTSAEPPRSSWLRRVRVPLIALLTQGLTPDRISLTLGVGAACSMFPLLGFSSLLNLAVGLWLRLNQPILQILNQALGPLHLVMIIAYVRLGEWLWRVEGGRFTLREMLHVFRDENIGEFLRSFGWAGIYALTAWALTTPVLVAVVYYALRPALRRLAAKTAGGE